MKIDNSKRLNMEPHNNNRSYIVFSIVWLTLFWGFCDNVGWLQGTFKVYVAVLWLSAIINIFWMEGAIQYSIRNGMVNNRGVLIYNLISVNIIVSLFLDWRWLTGTLLSTTYLTYVDDIMRARVIEVDVNKKRLEKLTKPKEDGWHT